MSEHIIFLRAAAAWFKKEGDGCARGNCEKAADAFTALEAENAHWRQAADAYKNDCEVEQRKRLTAEAAFLASEEAVARSEADNAALKAEVAGLKAALELERWGINEIGSGLSSEHPYDIAQIVITRRTSQGEQENG
jgi:hypothetical protein